MSSYVMQEWAKHNGRFREGVDEPSYVQWKTRLRCALHKAADIIHIKSESNDSKDTVNAFRVYSIKRRNGQKTDCRAGM